jgi:hypothetical protein
MIVAAMVALHVLMLAAYVLPAHWVPESARTFAAVYTRPLFHQQWRLFAPDPPACSCEILISFDDELWHSLHQQQDHYIEQRMVQNIARHVQTAVHASDPVRPLLEQALKDACSRHGDPALARYRLMEHCITDPRAPGQRELRITPIEF